MRRILLAVTIALLALTSVAAPAQAGGASGCCKSIQVGGR